MIGMAIAFTIDAIFALFVILIVVAHAMILNGVVVPQMVVQSKGILESWGNAFRMIRDNMGEFFGYLSIRVAITLAHMFIVFIIIFTITLFSFGYYTVTSSPDSFNLSAGIDPFSSFQWLQIPIQFLVTFSFDSHPNFERRVRALFPQGRSRRRAFRAYRRKAR